MIFSSLWSWLRRRAARRLPHLHFRIYTRQGCHLCEVAWEQLRRQQDRYRFQLDQTDVDADPDLAARYGTWVPVVTVNGKVRFRGRVNPVLLRRLLQAEATRSSRSAES